MTYFMPNELLAANENLAGVAFDDMIGSDFDDAMLLGEEAYEELGFGFLKKIGKSIGKAAKSVGKAARSVVKNPLVRMTVTGAALVFPPAAPAAAALIVADKVLTAAESGDAAKKAIAKGVIARTAGLAAKGDPNAKRAYAVLSKVKAAPPAARAKLRSVPRFKVTAKGRIARIA
jgi:hypothetical protein